MEYSRLKRFLNKSITKIFIGLIIVFGFIIISSFFFLEPNYWIILLNNLLLLTIIIFQNEFKSFFYKIGLFLELKFSKLIKKFDKKNKVEDEFLINMAEVLSKTCGVLSEQKIGALITIEINQLLDDFYKHSVILDSKISFELLYSIFQKTSPLHDGALIIKDFKIKAAGCFFPVSKNNKIKNNYGARHRAALGISEITDSLTLLVSEESGDIHVIKEGNISKNLTIGEIYEILLDCLHN